MLLWNAPLPPHFLHPVARVVVAQYLFLRVGVLAHNLKLLPVVAAVLHLIDSLLGLLVGVVKDSHYVVVVRKVKAVRCLNE